MIPDLEESTHHIYVEHSQVDVMFAMPELEFNPFRDRMCAVFSTAENEDASVSFEDFLDMASGLCISRIKCPL